MPALADVATELYGIAPEAFVVARNDRAKAARSSGDRRLGRDITALRRPSVAAWAVNRLVREHPEEIDRLLALAARLRAAQQGLPGADLRELNRQRHAVLSAVGEQARALAAEAGRPLSEGVGRQVDATLRAALADRAAGAAVRSGLLVRELEATGFAPVAVDDAVALPEAIVVPPEEPVPGAIAESEAAGADEARAHRAGAGRRAVRSTGEEAGAALSRRREREEARRAAEEAEQAAAAAATALRSAEDAVETISGRRSALAENIEEITRRLQALREEGDALAREERRARRDRDAAAQAARVADREAAHARARLANSD